ncbi:MAG: biotin/lipoyl-binding protein, partial [Actinomycetia bacterium]|nr:biotin/lipoyl-binding protein [Actinomycetes bacterium]
SGPPPPPRVPDGAGCISGGGGGAQLVADDGSVGVEAPLQGTIVAVNVSEGDAVAEGQQLLVMEAMKMEHEIRAVATGLVRQVAVEVGDTVFEGHPLVFVEAADVDVEGEVASAGVGLDVIRPDLQEMFDRRAHGLDENRPEAVAKRHGRGHRTARENVAQLVDEGSFVEYGRLMVAAQRRRRDFQDLLENTSGDGMVAGVGSVNGDLFDEDNKTQTMVMS